MSSQGAVVKYYNYTKYFDFVNFAIMREMKVFIPAKFTADDEDKKHINKLCDAVQDAKLEPFCFVRDVQDYKNTFKSAKEQWARIYDELGACDALLLDATEEPGIGSMVEAGMAFALRKPVIIAKRHSGKVDNSLEGISSTIIEYKDYSDLSKRLAKYDVDRNYNTTDRMTLIVMYLLLGGVVTWATARLFIPLAPVAAIVYWLVIRQLSATVRAFDRIVIYIPLLAVWWTGFAWLYPTDVTLALGWSIGYWLFIVFLLRRFKFSL